MPTLLIAGFGPFPGAPSNPTEMLVKQLARLRRPVLADVTIVGHVFETSYAAVDRDLPALIAQHRPDALLTFGLATRAKVIRIEMRARNVLALLPDVSGTVLRRAVIDGDGPAALALPAPGQRLLQAAQAAHVPARLSRDAGRYLCNYLCWRATEAVAAENGPRLAAFVHVPPVARGARPRAATHSVRSRASGDERSERRMTRGPLKSAKAKHHFTAADLVRAGENLLLAMVAATRRVNRT